MRRLRGRRCARSRARTRAALSMVNVSSYSRLGGFGLLDRVQDDGGSAGIAIAGHPLPRFSREFSRPQLGMRSQPVPHCKIHVVPVARCPPPTPLLSPLPQRWARAEAALSCSRCAVRRTRGSFIWPHREYCGMAHASAEASRAPKL